MSRVILIVGTFAVGLAGCARPIRLEIDVPQTSTGTVSARLTKGDKPPTPDTCALPCGVAIAPSTSSEVTVKAPGYYPAVMNVAYDQMLPISRGNVAHLVVPLVERPKRSQPAADAAAPEPGDAGPADTP